MNCRSGIISGATRSIVGSTDTKGRATRQTTQGSLAVIPSQFFGSNSTALADYQKFGAALRPFVGGITAAVLNPETMVPIATYGPVTDVID